jgi:putative ABC transport system substrate-binding protein
MPFVHALRDLGYVEGRNLILERRFAGGKIRALPRDHPGAGLLEGRFDRDVGESGDSGAKAVTQTVPIVHAGGNPVEAGLVESFARPDGNITGLTVDTGPEMVGKRLQIIRLWLPRCGARTAKRRARMQLCMMKRYLWDTTLALLGVYRRARDLARWAAR